MTDRKKVIEGLEVCLKNIDQQDCPNDCPYLSDCSKYENRVIFQPLMRDALALLKQEPKTGKWLPCKASIHPYGYDVKCSECGLQMGSTFGYRFCPKCGVKMET